MELKNRVKNCPPYENLYTENNPPVSRLFTTPQDGLEKNSRKYLATEIISYSNLSDDIPWVMGVRLDF